MGLAEKTSELISHLERIQASQSPTAFACSFGVEDMVVLDAIARPDPLSPTLRGSPPVSSAISTAATRRGRASSRR